jgi:hypothetical protein
MTRSDKWQYMKMSGVIDGGPTDAGFFQFPVAGLIFDILERFRMTDKHETADDSFDDIPTLEDWERERSLAHG